VHERLGRPAPVNVRVPGEDAPALRK